MSNKIIVELTTGTDSGISYYSAEKIFKVEGVLEGPIIYYKNDDDIDCLRETYKSTFPCTNCSRTFNRKGDMLRHLRTHTGEKPFDCPECGDEFSRKDDMRRHLRTHNGIKPHTCIYCKRSFSRKSDMEKHYRKHKLKTMRCPKCDLVFMQKRQLLKHIQTHVEASGFACHECGKTFPRRSMLKLKKLDDGGKNKGYFCVDCNRKASDKESQLESLQERPFECPQCGDCFRRKSDMVRHLRLHSGVKPFTCETCSRPFSRKEDMMRHSLTHAKVKPYSCPTCDKGFARKSDFEVHVISHTLDAITSSEEIREESVLPSS